MWGKLHRELIVITIISVLILAVSFAFNFSASQKDILERQTYDYLLDAAHHTKVILHTEIQRQNELLDIVLRNAPRYEGQKDNLINLLSTVSNTGHFSTVGLTYRGQKTLMSNGEEIDILDQDYYKRALEGEEVVEGPVVLPSSSRKVVILAKPLYKDEEVIGVVHEAYDLDNATKTLLAVLNMQQDRITMIADEKGDVIMGIGNGRQGNFYNFLKQEAIVCSMSKQDLEKAIAKKESGAFYYTDIYGETQYVVFAPVDVNDWYTFQIVSGTNLLADQQMLNKIARDTMGKYFLLICLCFIVIIYIWRQIEKDRLKQINAEIEGLRLTAGLMEGCMFEFDLKARKFLIVKNTGDSAESDNTEKQVLEKLSGFITDSIAKKNDSSLDRYFHEDDLPAVQKALTELKRAGRTVFQGRLHTSDGDYHWYRFYMAVVFDDKRQIKRVLGNVLDINDTQNKFARMQHKAERDPLTGIYNRAVFEKYVNEVLADSSKRQHAFFLLDIDDFKNVNDSRGHAFGDTVLCELTANLERSFRSSDLLGRIGGDEFAVLMCDITSMENALVKAGQICSLYTKGAAKEGLKISCSIGMVFCESDDGAAFDDLYQKADSALYKAKGKGKNVFVVFDENML
ncbi:sensor domain-containing diguanylate cyclase [Phascolarctobacterium faecium]|jgi:diguanylate cyclase (GGDEF)-like protein|uniref:sensor domain-containing diguanylate cyclase n=1 Tax=Phascolarctobacterium faecium TaxID=33025 RepID=UPI003522C050